MLHIGDVVLYVIDMLRCCAVNADVNWGQFKLTVRGREERETVVK